jgi:hypothetical protein
MCTDKSIDSARNLQTPGDELYRHDLTTYFLKHPCQLEVFNAQIEACETEADVAEVVRQTWEDLIPAFVRYSNRGPVETPRSRYEANHVRIASAAAGMRGVQA